MTAPSPNMEQLVAECQGLVRSLALKIHRTLPPHIELDDVIGYGQRGLVEAASEFDPTRGNRFSTFAYYRIRGAMYDGLSKMSWFSRGHYRHVRYEQLAGEVLHGESAAENPPPADNPEADMRWLRDLSRALAVVHLVTHAESPTEREEASLAESSRWAPHNQAIKREISEKVGELIIALPPDEGTLVRAAYFEGLTLQDVARQMGISKSWATRLHTRALHRLARSLRMLGLASDKG